MDQTVERVRSFIDRHRMIEKGDRVLLSLSAGKDSMFLLDALLQLREAYRCDIGVFHLNHMVRGEEADADERHVASVARTHGLDCIVRKHDFTSQPRHGESFEERARTVRYAMLDEAAAAGRYDKIATGHTNDDNIETLLLRILSGTGLYGLKGIPPVRGAIIRPLLGLTAREIYGYLSAKSIPWREDSTNSESSHSRNFIRNELLPLARARFPMLESALISLSGVAADSVELLDRLLDAAYPCIVERQPECLYIDAGEILHDRPAFQHVVSSAIRSYFSTQVSRSMMDELYDTFKTPKANAELFRNGSILAEKSFRDGRSMLKISPCPVVRPQPVEWEKAVRLAGGTEQIVPLDEIGVRVIVRPCDFAYYENFEKNNSSVFVTVDDTTDTIYIRNRRMGDKIRTEYGEKKLKDFFIERKLSAFEKDRIPILVIGSSVAAVMPGFLNDTSNRVSSDFLVDKKSKKVISVIAYR